MSAENSAGGRAAMKKELPSHLVDYKHVWVFIEYEHGQIHTVSLELIGEGRKLADKLGVELAAVLVGGHERELQQAAQVCFEHGADVAYLSHHPVLKDPRVRRAMTHAIDRQAIVDALWSGRTKVPRGLQWDFFGPMLLGDWSAPAYDPAEAKRLLKEAGYDGAPIPYQMLNNYYTNQLATGQIMAEQWKEAGIRAKITVLPDTQYWEVWTKLPFGFTTWAHRPLGVLNYALAYRTGVPWNESKFSNAEFDRLLTQAEGTLDVDKRREIMAKLEQIMLDEAPVVVPLYRALFTFSQKRVTGFKMHPTAYINANEIAVTS